MKTIIEKTTDGKEIKIMIPETDADFYKLNSMAAKDLVDTDMRLNDKD